MQIVKVSKQFSEKSNFQLNYKYPIQLLSSSTDEEHQTT